MRYRLDYWQRLGDILQLFPGAKYLRDQGHEVFIECKPEYHGIFDTVDYVKPSWCSGLKFDKVIPLGIHPTGGGSFQRYEAYRKSGMKWRQFIYDQTPEIAGSHGPVKFTTLGHCQPKDYGLSMARPLHLLAPFGRSQVVKYNPKILWDWCRRMWGFRPMLLGGSLGAPGIVAFKLRDLPDIISWAHKFAAINSAPAIIAAGVRKDYIHFPQTGKWEQDDTAIPGISQVVVVKNALIEP